MVACSLAVLPRPRTESAGVCLLRCRRGIGELLAALKERLWRGSCDTMKLVRIRHDGFGGKHEGK